MELAELADEAMRALARDAQFSDVAYADVRAVEERSESVDVRDDTVEGISRDLTRGVGIRVLVDGRWGFAATSAATPVALRDATELAVRIARASAAVGGDPVRLDDTPPPSGSYVTPFQRDPFEVPLDERVEHLLDAVEAGRGAVGIGWVEATHDAWKRRTAFRSTEGGHFEQTVLQVGGGVRGTAVGDGEVQRRSYPSSFRGQFSSGGWEDVLALDLVGRARGTCDEAVALLAAPDLPETVGTLVLTSNQLALQVHESVGHPTELDRILGYERAYAGTSWVSVEDRGRLQYASPIVTITADATTPGALGTFGYDDEGVEAHSSPIIVDGMLEGFLTNRETAAILGERSNGTARADSWGTIPLVRMNNVSLQPREGDLASIVADTDAGFLLSTNTSWSIDDRRLDFQFGCEAAYEIKNGQLGRLYRNPTYAGRTPEFWRSCDALGGQDDWQVWGIPNCGKGQPGQVARVAHGAPTGRFRDVRMGTRG